MDEIFGTVVGEVKFAEPEIIPFYFYGKRADLIKWFVGGELPQIGDNIQLVCYEAIEDAQGMVGLKFKWEIKDSK